MLEFRPVFFVIGILLTTLALAMVMPAVADAAVGNPDWQVFLAAAGLTLFIGGALVLTMRTNDMALTIRQAFLLTMLSWLAVAVFGSLPFVFAELDMSYTDAFFEAMSGVTTTGSTVISGLDQAPPGILLWRALLQWLGGIGIIVMAVAVLPMLQVGGMQIFRMESSDRSEKVLPRAAQIASGIGTVYLTLTMICALFYWFYGMTGFEAVTHAMTTIATGGFSTSDQSLGHFNSAAIDWTAVIFMIVGSLPFVLYLQAVRGHPGELVRDAQVKTFLVITIVLVTLVTCGYWATSGGSLLHALRMSALNAVSIMTGTGYTTANFDAWGAFAVPLFFIAMFIGGCAGSTTCGIKIFRFQVLYATAITQMRQLLQPHGVFIAYYNRRPIPEEVAVSVMSFVFLYVLCFAVLATVLGALGLEFLTAVSGAATALSNVGPGLGEIIGPASTFGGLPDPAKWALSAGMLLGRLELFTVLILFAPSFWRD